MPTTPFSFQSTETFVMFSFFISLPPSKNEIDKKLEQLRALDAGIKIGITYVENVPISVDTVEDLMLIENILKNTDENK